MFIDARLSPALDRKSVITVPQQHKNFLVAGAKKAKSHNNGRLVTLLLDVVFLVFILHNSLNIRFETGVLNTLKYINSSSLRFLDNGSKNTFRRDLNFKEIENWSAQYLKHAHSRITKVVAAMKSCSPLLGLTCSKALSCQGK